MSRRSRIALVVADVDGTLVTSDKRLTSGAVGAVARLRDAGIAFAITSGRPPRGMAMLTGPLQLTTPVAAFNGGMLVQPDLKTSLCERTLPTAVTIEVVEQLLRAGLDAWIYRGADWFVRRRDAPHVAKEEHTVQFAPTVIPTLSSVVDAVVKIVGVTDDLGLAARCERELRDQVGPHASVARSQPYYVDVTHPDANKGMVVRELARRLGVPLDQIAAIGDMPNDVLMFSLSGLGIAMGNASAEVQRCAGQVTSSNDEEGFARAVDRFIFGDAAGLGGTAGAPSQLGLPPGMRACLFDLDGVLTKTATLHAAAWKQTFDEQLRARSLASGAPFVAFDPVHDYEQYVDGKPRLDGVRAFVAARGLELPEGDDRDPGTASTVHGIANRKNELLLALLHRQRVATYEGSVRYVQAVRRAGLRTAVVSSSKNCQEVLSSAGIAEQFDVRIDGLVAAEQKLAGKPAPDTYLAAARALGVEPALAAVFEDALAGVEAGRAGRFGYVVGVDRLGQAEELRRHGADVAVTDLAALLEAP